MYLKYSIINTAKNFFFNDILLQRNMKAWHSSIVLLWTVKDTTNGVNITSGKLETKNILKNIETRHSMCRSYIFLHFVGCSSHFIEATTRKIVKSTGYMILIQGSTNTNTTMSSVGRSMDTYAKDPGFNSRGFLEF